MVISLYTSRIILRVLGVEDFGIYNVVGGIVALFGFLNNAMGQATQRFLSYELGNGNKVKLRQTFTMTFNVHIIISIFTFIVAESIGLWFLNSKMNIPNDRIIAANIVYQFSIISSIISIILVPYNATIFAHEKMGLYAWITIIEVLLKLFAVIVLQYIRIDKLSLYSGLIAIISVIISVIYIGYCNKKFKETKFYLYWDKDFFKIIFKYTSWSLFGNIAGVAMNQGTNIVLNIFFGPVVNAARGITFQVKTAIASFVYNFQGASIPQIIKLYSTNEKEQMLKLVLNSSKISFFLVFFLAFPVFLELDFLLTLWLGKVPDYVILFCRIALINTLIDCLSGTLQNAVQATGQIKIFQLSVGVLLLLNLPISYLLFLYGLPPEYTMYVSCIISLIILFAQLFVVKSVLNWSMMIYVKEVVFVNVKIVLISCILILPIWYYFKNVYSVFMILISMCIILITIISIGLKKSERELFYNFVKSKIKILKNVDF